MNNNTTTMYPTMIPTHYIPEESAYIFDTSYNGYSSHPIAYSDYPPQPSSSKLEAIDYGCWPAITAHNILTNRASTVHDHIQPTSPPPSSSQTIETLTPISSAHLSQNNSSSTISATHHHHHIHQHLYPSSTSSPSSPPPQPLPPPPYNDQPVWLGRADYQFLHPTTNTPSYRHYSTPCSIYPPNNFYDPSQSQWASPSLLPIKYESPYNSPPSHFESSDSINHCHEQIPKHEPSESPQQSNWIKHETSSTLMHPIPPKNLLNGKTRTRDKYRIVYTDQQRYELENEFITSKYISIPRKSALSLTLSLSERQIKIWFQNRRAKERKLNKKRHDVSTTHQLNNSNDADSPSDGGMESPTYYQNYT